ncbi:hypothetical protein NDU88_006110 [Pleurodeles waltl]|uniref:Uncharacterized protein n=1 Tax=Pleurodeles waltl TaxID=8319 RepID=A0AAV7UP14_PLEWA|nr:hypothetical protein NDU88_006110 [Pleurodeles waltl]
MHSSELRAGPGRFLLTQRCRSPGARGNTVWSTRPHCGRALPPDQRNLRTWQRTAGAAHLLIVLAGAHAVPPPLGRLPPRLTAAHTIYPAWPTVAPRTHAIRRSCWLAPGRGSQGVWDTSLVTADYPQLAGQRRQPTFRLTGVPTYSTYSTRSADTEEDFHQWVYPARRRTTMQRLFQSPEDAWTWFHAKGLVHSATDTLEDATWLTPHSKRRKRKSSKAGPSRAQAVTEQEKAIQEAAHFSHNSFLALSDKFQFPSDSDTGATSPSRTSGDERAPLITPRLADDL